MLQIATAFFISELLRENQQGLKIPPPRLGVSKLIDLYDPWNNSEGSRKPWGIGVKFSDSP